MGTDDEFLSVYRATIEGRLREQIARHRAINPVATTQQIKDIQLTQEIERIEKAVADPELSAGLIELVKDLLKKL